MVLGDVHRTDQASKELVDALSIALKDRPSSQLLMVVTTTDLIQGREPAVHGWSPSAHEELTYEAADEAEIRTLVNHRLAGQCGSDTDITDNMLARAGRNPLFAHALVGIVERILTTLDEAPNDLTASRFTESPEWQGLAHVCEGRWPELRPEVLTDMQSAAVVGDRFTLSLLAQIWSVPEEAVAIRVDALCASGLVVAQGDEFAFLSGELAAQLADRCLVKPGVSCMLRLQLFCAVRCAEKDASTDNPHLSSTSLKRGVKHFEETETFAMSLTHFGQPPITSLPPNAMAWPPKQQSHWWSVFSRPAAGTCTWLVA